MANDLVTQFKKQVTTNVAEFEAALPKHIPVERFTRILTTAVLKNEDLLVADRRTLLTSAMLAAQDGLLPDGRDGALVIYNTKIKVDGRDKWIKSVQWMPMVAGLLKKMRNSGELASVVAKIVYAGDKFRCWIDDTGEHIEYEAGDDQDRNIVRCVFAMARLKDGTNCIEVLMPSDIEKIRNVSRAKDSGPWVMWWDQMAIKSAIRRLAKRVPMSTDLDDLIRRDDALYDFENKRSEPPAILSAPSRQAATLDEFAAGKGETVDPETGEIEQQTPIDEIDPTQIPENDPNFIPDVEDDQ